MCLMNWTIICIWYNLVVIPQLIIISVLAWTRMLSTVYLHPELVIATMTSNFTFGCQYGWKTIFITWFKKKHTLKWSIVWWIELSLVKIYPQCKMAKILYLKWQEDPTHEEEQRIYEKYLSGKEKLLENLPQVFVKNGILAFAYLPKQSV